MYVLDMANADILKAEEMNFELLSVDFHSKDITGVDTCIKKPLVVTCSTDKSVRVWNYLDKSVELLRDFQGGGAFRGVSPLGPYTSSWVSRISSVCATC